jgi:peptidoglycan/xylan/chitin deacetylase (PgdA/CDA1 family)
MQRCDLKADRDEKSRSSSEAAKTTAWCHVDMDGLDAIYRHRGYLYSGRDGGFYRSAVENALEFFDAEGLRATFFFIAHDLDIEDRRQALADIRREGHAIASHGLSHQKLSTLPPKVRCAEIAESKKRIEDASSVECLGFRAPSYAMDMDSLRLCGEAGYLYDSSLFTGNAMYENMRDCDESKGIRRVFEDCNFFEVPIPRLNRWLPPFHPCYSFYLSRYYFRLGAMSHQRRYDSQTMLFHLSDFSSQVSMPQGLRQRFYTNDFFTWESKRAFLHDLIRFLKPGCRFVRLEDHFNETLSKI